MSEPQQRELLSLSNQQLTELLERFAQPPTASASSWTASTAKGGRSSISSPPYPFPCAGSSPMRPLCRTPNYREEVHLLRRHRPLPLLFSDGQSVETVWMPEGDGGEAGDGSDSGDEELSKDLGVILSGATEGSAVEEAAFPGHRHQSLATPTAPPSASPPRSAAPSTASSA